MSETALVTTEPHRDTSPEGLMAMAIDKGISVEGLEKLMVLAGQVRDHRAKTAFIAALASFQEECPTIEKTRQVFVKGQARYKYASMEDIKEVVSPILGRLGLSYAFDTNVENGLCTVFCIVRHEEGHQEQSSFVVPIGNSGFMSAPQEFAAALTYCKRYALINSLGLAIGDEDNDAVPPDKPAQKPQQPAQKPRQQAPAPKPDVPAKDPELEAATQEWNKFLDTCPNVKELNNQLPALKKWPDRVWKSVWKTILLPWAETNGWVWESESKLFFEPTS